MPSSPSAPCSCPPAESDDDDEPTVGAGTEETGPLSGSSFKVGSKEFTEQLILGQITIQVLEDAGADVSDETGLVGSNTVRAALISGDIDMYWEYTGTGWINHLGNTQPLKDAREQYDAVAKADLEKNGVVWLDPAPFNNTYGIATSSENATALAVTKLSDLAPLQQSNPDAFTLCAAAEFLARDDGLPGLEAAYGFTFGSKISELELGLVYASVDKGDPCKFGEVFATAGQIAALGLTVLERRQAVLRQLPARPQRAQGRGEDGRAADGVRPRSPPPSTPPPCRSSTPGSTSTANSPRTWPATSSPRTTSSGPKTACRRQGDVLIVGTSPSARSRVARH